ncbi:hypothetical protein GCM10009789_25960 [Kribbella sancticallisti]|uniref:Phage gp6-like head-tail connector protein n=1 Tax=Kribbella sancticallisti TaxID=460087 RepID=A0ABN2D9C9_9ACTN
MEASEWAEMVSAAVGIALSRQNMEVSESERSALDELIADAGDRLASDEDYRESATVVELQSAAEALVRGLLHVRSSGTEFGLEGFTISTDRVRSWICPLYPFC